MHWSQTAAETETSQLGDLAVQDVNVRATVNLPVYSAISCSISIVLDTLISGEQCCL